VPDIILVNAALSQIRNLDHESQRFPADQGRAPAYAAVHHAIVRSDVSATVTDPDGLQTIDPEYPEKARQHDGACNHRNSRRELCQCLTGAADAIDHAAQRKSDQDETSGKMTRF